MPLLLVHNDICKTKKKSSKTGPEYKRMYIVGQELFLRSEICVSDNDSKTGLEYCNWTFIHFFCIQKSGSLTRSPAEISGRL